MFDSLASVSLELLRAFESAARHRSFTAAAVELGTTQPAISQQIKKLEDQLAVRLFDRVYRGIELTDNAVALFEEVHAAMLTLNMALDQVMHRDQHEVLQVATDFAFAAYWLMPRLHRFHEANPQVDVSLVTSERSFNMIRAETDIAILFGDGRFRQGESHWLFDEEVYPVCSPRLVEGLALPAASSLLLQQPLLHLRGESSSQWFDWAGLFKAIGLHTPPAPGQLRFDNYTLLIQAAIAGQGVAIGWRHLVDALVDQGLLCRPVEAVAVSRMGYHVVLPQRKRRGRTIQRFLDWVMAEQMSMRT